MKVLLKFFNLIFCFMSLCACSHRPFLSGGKLAFEDNFDGNELNEEKWNIETGTGRQYGLNGWGNNEKQFYSANNVFVRDGILHLEARRDRADQAFPYTSGKITTGGVKNDDGVIKNQKFAFPYGRIEARIKSSKGMGFWPAFWLIGADSNRYGGHEPVSWPACGEIDILEIKGGIENKLHSTVHYGADSSHHRYKGDSIELDVNMADDWHVYGAAWDKHFIHFLFDGKIWQTINMKDINEGDLNLAGVFTGRNGFVINLNLAVGGNFINGRLPPDSVFESDYPEENRSLQADWVRVYVK